MGGINVQNRLGSGQSGRGLAVGGLTIHPIYHYATDHQQISSGMSVGLRGSCALGDTMGNGVCISGRIANLYSAMATGNFVPRGLPVYVVG